MDNFDNTMLDEIVDFPVLVMSKLANNPSIVKLLTDDPNADPGDEDTEDFVYNECLYDWGFIPDTASTAGAYICVEAEMLEEISPTMQSFRLYVTVVCNSRFMRLDPEKFPSMCGNRRDNLARYINEVLSGDDEFGVGTLILDSAKVIGAPKDFTARELTYDVPAFAWTSKEPDAGGNNG